MTLEIVFYDKFYSCCCAEVDNAWKKYLMGDYKQVLNLCRNALDGIANKIVEAGYEVQDNEEEYQCSKCSHIWSKSNVDKKEIRTVPNWKASLMTTKLGTMPNILEKHLEWKS
jgi:hypothetical protein